MDDETRLLLQALCWSAAYALACGLAYRESPGWAVRFAAGLLAGALFARLTTLVLVGRLFDPILWTSWGGGTLLAVPAGLLASAFIDASRSPVRYFDFALRHTCVGLGVARLGCFVAGCCAKAEFAGTQLIEAAVLLAGFVCLALSALSAAAMIWASQRGSLSSGEAISWLVGIGAGCLFGGRFRFAELFTLVTLYHVNSWALSLASRRFRDGGLRAAVSSGSGYAFALAVMCLLKSSPAFDGIRHLMLSPGLYLLFASLHVVHTALARDTSPVVSPDHPV